MNYMQLDTDRMEYVASSIHVVWDGILQVSVPIPFCIFQCAHPNYPLSQIVGYTCLLLKFLGPSVFAGIAAMLVVIPVNAFFLKRLF